MTEKQKIEEIEYEEETPEVDVWEENSKNNSQSSEEPLEISDSSNSKIEDIPADIPDKLDKIEDAKIRGRIIIFNAKKSEFAKNLNITKAGDYIEKK